MSRTKRAIIRAYREGIDDWKMLQSEDAYRGDNDSVASNRRSISRVKRELRMIKSGNSTTADRPIELEICQF